MRDAQLLAAAWGWGRRTEHLDSGCDCSLSSPARVLHTGAMSITAHTASMRTACPTLALTRAQGLRRRPRAPVRERIVRPLGGRDAARHGLPRPGRLDRGLQAQARRVGRAAARARRGRRALRRAHAGFGWRVAPGQCAQHAVHAYFGACTSRVLHHACASAAQQWSAAMWRPDAWPWCGRQAVRLAAGPWPVRPQGWCGTRVRSFALLRQSREPSPDRPAPPCAALTCSPAAGTTKAALQRRSSRAHEKQRNRRCEGTGGAVGGSKAGLGSAAARQQALDDLCHMQRLRHCIHAVRRAERAAGAQPGEQVAGAPGLGLGQQRARARQPRRKAPLVLAGLDVISGVLWRHALQAATGRS